MLHFSGKHLELKCTLEIQADVPVLHRIKASVQEHPWPLLELGGVEVVVAVNEKGEEKRKESCLTEVRL